MDSASKPKKLRISKRIAEKRKDAGNKLFAAHDYHGAIGLYTEAISHYPENAIYFGNRANCHAKVGNFQFAIEDAQKALEIDAKYAKAHYWIAKSCMALGDFDAAEKTLKCYEELEPENKELAKEMATLRTARELEKKVNACYKRGDFVASLVHVEKLVKVASKHVKYQLLRAECLALTGRTSDSNFIVGPILKLNPNDADANYIRGLTFYYGGNVTKSLEFFEKATKANPKHVKAKEILSKAKALHNKKEEAEKLFKKGRYLDSVAKYTEALAAVPPTDGEKSNLYYVRGLANEKGSKFQDAVDDFTKAIELKKNYHEAILKRAKLYVKLEKYEEAVKDFKEALEIRHSPETHRLLLDAKAKLRQTKPKELYNVLGVKNTATEAEIKAAYKRLALEHHPDKHMTSSLENQRLQGEKFVAVGSAYATLSDPVKRARYDRSNDSDDEAVYFDDFSSAFAFDIFDMFFAPFFFGHGRRFPF